MTVAGALRRAVTQGSGGRASRSSAVAAVVRARAGPRGVGERGSALVEFVLLAVLVAVPLFYLVLTLARLQAGAYAVTAAAREGGRAFVTAPVAEVAPARAQAAARLAFADQAFDDGAVQVRCDRSPCLTPEGHVEVVATVRVPLPLVPDFLSGALPTSIPLSATHVEAVGRFTGDGDR
jgi:hypothetical protein